MTTQPIGSGRVLFSIPDFRIWAMNGAPSLATAEQSAAQANTCETCSGSGEIDQFAGGGWPGQAMQFVDCPDCANTTPKIRGTK